MAFVNATTWVSRTDEWRTDSEHAGGRYISQGWQGTSYGQTKTFMTAVKMNVPSGHIITSLKLKFTPAGGYSGSKTLKIVRPKSGATKTFTTSTTSESVRPDSSATVLQTASVTNGTTATITANSSLLAFFKEGYNYFIINNFETGSSSYSAGYINGSDAQVEFTTAQREYTITYNANGGSGAPAAQTKIYGTALTLSSTIPTRAGYSFLGWSTSSTATSATYSAGGSYTANAAATLYAVWSTNQYTLTIKPNGGTWNGSTSNSTAKQNYNSTKSIAAPTRTGYTFCGWYKTYYGTLSASTSQVPLFSTTTTSLLPSAYNTANDGTVTVSAPANDTSGGYGKVITITTTAASATPGNGGFKFTQASSANAEFIHIFRAKIPVGYTAWHKYNSVGTGATFTWLTDQYGTGEWQDYAYKLQCGSSGTFSTFGYIALAEGDVPMSWYLTGNQITKSPTAAQTYTYGAGDCTMTAQWVPNRYTVTFNANGGSVSTTSKTVTYASTYGTLPTPTKDGYIFNGWYTASSGGTKITENSTVSITAAQTLYAQWAIEQYTFTLGSATGVSTSGSTASGKKNYNTTITLKATASTGYTWNKWSSSNTSLVADKTAANTTFAMPKGDITMTPVATAHVYSIQYNGNGYTGGSMSNTSHTYGIAKNLRKNTFVRAGYEFLGWSTTQDGEVEYTDEESVVNLTATNNATVTLYAVWKPLSQMFIWHDGAWHRALRYVYVTS